MLCELDSIGNRRAESSSCGIMSIEDLATRDRCFTFRSSGFGEGIELKRKPLGTIIFTVRGHSGDYRTKVSSLTRHSGREFERDTWMK